MKKILILHFHNHSTEPRVRREYDCLGSKYQLFGLGYVDCQREGIEFIAIKKPKWNWKMKLIQRFWLLLRCYKWVYWHLPQVKEAQEKLKDYEFDVILANNEEAVPLALKYKKKAKVIVDMHEYAPREFEVFFWWKFYFAPYKHWLCRTYLPQADYVYSVNETLAKEYTKNYGIKCDFITSAAKYYPLPKTFNNSPTIKLLHHGYANPDRRIEKMIETMDYVDNRFTLDLMLVANYFLDYYEELKAMAQTRNNVRIIPPVPFEEIIPFSTQYDIGMFLVPPTTYNLQMCLPNKFFEFIQARLALAIGPNPEMAKYLKAYDLGVVAPDFTPQSMAKALNALTKEQILIYKENANKAAEILNATKEGEKLLKIVEKVLET